MRSFNFLISFCLFDSRLVVAVHFVSFIMLTSFVKREKEKKTAKRKGTRFQHTFKGKMEYHLDKYFVCVLFHSFFFLQLLWTNLNVCFCVCETYLCKISQNHYFCFFIGTGKVGNDFISPKQLLIKNDSHSSHSQTQTHWRHGQDLIHSGGGYLCIAFVWLDSFLL